MFKIASLRSTAFTWDAALSLAYASKLAYDPPQLVLKTLKSDWGFGDAQFLDRADTQGFVALGDGVVLVAFRGTESLGDWLGNLDVGWTDLPPAGKMHRGFVEALDLVTQDLATLLTPTTIAGRKVWFTGHSLGGALCAVAAVRLHNQLNIHAIHTFGQPRVGDKDTRNFFVNSLNDRYFRFVNDRDLIARVPPGFEHVGTLIHFDAHGNVERAASEAARVALEVPSLTPEEFEALKADIKATKAEMRALGMPEGAPTLDRSLEGLIPGIPDHRLERYITAVRRQTGSVAKGETLAAERVIRSALEAVREKSGDLKPTESISALVRLRDSRAKLPESVKTGPRNGNIMSVRGTLDALRQLESDPNVVSLQISRDAGFSELATSLPFVHGDIVHRPPIAERGDKALLGLIDTGIDVLHEAFLDDQGASRILAIWDQSNNTGPTPAVADPACFSNMTYGTLYLASDIAEMIAGNETAPLNLRDFREHGTHVASIAAGSAVGLLSDGMAPAARLVVVVPKLKTDAGDPFSVGYSVSHNDALYFLKRVSEGGTTVLTEKLPMAVNVSLGMNAGAHDGTSPLEASFDSITNKGQDEGFAIVKSAGNERGWGGHARTTAFQGLKSIAWNSGNAVRTEDYIEVWYNGRDEIEFSLTDPVGNVSSVASESNPVVHETLGGNFCTLDLVSNHDDNGDNCLKLRIVPQSAQIQSGRWALNVIGVDIRTTGLVDVWVERDDDSRAVRFAPEEQQVTLSIPGTADTVIAVAASHSTPPLQLTASSSSGPTRSGGAKPDICAPGQDIVAARANTNNHRDTQAMTGTSMAAPHVTGALALVLSHRQKQIGRSLPNAVQIRSALIRTARFSSRIHNPDIGHGLLDAKSLFDRLK